MPLPPYHLGSGLGIGLGLFRFLDFPTLLVASVIVDVEPFVVLVFKPGYIYHGFFHSFLGGSVLAIVTGIAVYLLRGWIQRIMAVFKLAQKSSFRKIMWTSFLGAYLHVLLDSFTHNDMKPFYPIDGNPFLDVFTYKQVELLCVIVFIIAVLMCLSWLAISRARR
jgi:membrane-bound metal-dependent hydrolase YbcI (DUF457 family)